MATTAAPYGTFLNDLGAAVHTLGTDTDKVALLTSSYIPDLDAHDAYDDVSSFEATGTGYTAGGKTLTSVTRSYDAGNNRTTYNADPLTWTALNTTFRYAVVYKSTGTPSSSKLIGLIDFGENRVYTGDDFQLSFTSGLVRLTSA